MLRLIYADHLCRDCGEANDRPTCACGYMRPLGDAYFIVPAFRPITWSGSTPYPHLVIRDPLELREIRDAVIGENDWLLYLSMANHLDDVAEADGAHADDPFGWLGVDAGPDNVLAKMEGDAGYEVAEAPPAV